MYLLKFWQSLERVAPATAAALLPRRFVPNASYHNPMEVAAILAETAFQKAKDDAGGIQGSKNITYLTGANLILHAMPTYFVAQPLLTAALATTIPPTLKLESLEWPLETMLFILPVGGLKLPSGADVRFLAFSRHQPCSERPVLDPLPYAPAIGFPAVSFWAVSTNNLEWASVLDFRNDTLAGWTDSETPHVAEVTTSEGDHWNNTLRSVTMKIILTLSARPSLIQLGHRVRASKIKKGRTKSELWSPNIIGQDYKPRVTSDQNQDEPSSGTGKRLHWVRGHFRQQPYGVRENPRYETIWIEPFLSGTV